MSFNPITNSWGGPGSDCSGPDCINYGSYGNYDALPFSVGQNSYAVGGPRFVAIAGTFPPQPTFISTSDIGEQFFEIPNYLLLRNMTSDHGRSLVVERGGYSGENPAQNKESLTHCASTNNSSQLYCNPHEMHHEMHHRAKPRYSGYQ